LFNDAVQKSDAPKSLKSAALSETTDVIGPIVITFPKSAPISAIGIGNTNGTVFSIHADICELTALSSSDGANIVTHDAVEIYADHSYENEYEYNFIFSGNGLYPLGRTIRANKITITTDASYIGRFGAGIGVNIPTSIAKQPGWGSTSKPRATLSGQIVHGAGGYNYRTLSLDARYKIGREALSELASGYKHTGSGYPFFIDLADESYKLPFDKFYGVDSSQQQMSFESGVKRFLYSRRFEFRECF